MQIQNLNSISDYFFPFKIPPTSQVAKILAKYPKILIPNDQHTELHSNLSLHESLLNANATMSQAKAKSQTLCKSKTTTHLLET